MAKAKETAAPGVVTIPPEAKKSTTAMELVQQAPQYMQRAEAIEVNSPESHSAAITFLRDNAARIKECEGERELINKPLHQAWVRSCDFFNRLAAPFTSVDKIVRAKVLGYEKAERDKADAARRLADDVARKERERKENEAREVARKAQEKVDLERKQALQKKQEQEEAQRIADAARAAGDAAAAAEAQKVANQAGNAAAAAERKAETIASTAEAKVETLQQQAQSVVAAIVEAPALKVEGRSARKVTKFEIIDASKINRMFLSPNEKKIGDQVRSLKHEAIAIVGEGSIRVWEEDDLSIKAAK